MMRYFPGFLITMMIIGYASGDTEDIFSTRILPIFQSNDPSSCVQCHLAGVDLKDYILPSAEQTFVSLRDQGLIDIEDPEESKILDLIHMKPKSPGYPEIDEKQRRAEYEAFREWIVSSCKDPHFRDAQTRPAMRGKPHLPDEVIRHSRIDQVQESFTRNIWALRFRCAGCHMANGYNYEKLSKEHGEQMGWLKVEGPEATLRYILSSYLIDIEDPEQSLLLLKPLNEIEHGGGLKMARGDTDYMAFLNWIEDYSRILNGDYQTAEDLPRGNPLIGSEIWIRAEHLPGEWFNRLGFFTVHGKGDDGNWIESRGALTSFNIRENKKFGHFAQGFLMIDSKQNDTPGLPEGDYQIRLYLDQEERDTNDFDLALSASTLTAVAEIHTSWQPGWKQATLLEADQLHPVQ